MLPTFSPSGKTTGYWLLSKDTLLKRPKSHPPILKD